MNNFYNIKKIFIVSVGRTGTGFLGKNLSKLSSNFFSVHEPDTVSIRKENLNDTITKIKKIGFINLVILKLLGISGTRNISLKKLKNDLPTSKVHKKLVKDRKWINEEYNFYIETSWHLFGVVEDLAKFPNSKVIIIFRDPRDWVTSAMNKKYWYDNLDLLTKINFLGLKRITPKNVGITNNQWQTYTRFQKFCWVWNYSNTFFLEILSKQYKNVTYFFYEDIFIQKEESKINDFLQFSLGRSFLSKYVYDLRNLMQSRIHETSNVNFPKWHSWDINYCQELHNFCGALMQKLGYGEEPEWKKKINKY